MKFADIYGEFGISKEVRELVEKAEASLKENFAEIEAAEEYNQLKVLHAMQKNRVTEACLLETTGYGYNDLGRETLENVYADLFGTEDALVRSQIICGTHALAVAISGNTRPGDMVYSPCGLPYDTLQTVLGLNGARGSLKEYGVGFSYTELLPDGSFDYERIRKEIPENVALIEIQRSRGYSLRPSFSVDSIGELIGFLKELKPDAKIMVDNCYGEFVETKEPSEVGADMMVGSLIKNPGGGIAPVGGYIVGTEECVENAAARLTAPGIGKEIGPSLGNNRPMFMGLYHGPQVTAAALKGAVLLAKVYEMLGFDTFPKFGEKRSDIVQTVVLKTSERLTEFCRGVQNASPVDACYAPEPNEMPGYDCEVIMAAGCFTSGSSIELSADGPLREPYAAYYQGGLNYTQGKLAVMKTVQFLKNGSLI
ncbi:MAG: methionine gamma-lyase family protein [Eubacteriales bacterium]|nr:methionine gamma-lyase family protein [Eubacteriales bacterium]